MEELIYVLLFALLGLIAILWSREMEYSKTDIYASKQTLNIMGWFMLLCSIYLLVKAFV